jgi:3-oxoacyl-[acyl-carrier protein] reductase
MSSMEKPLAGELAIVTGASRGIGRATALKLAEAGAIVAGTGRTIDSRSAIDEMLEPYNGFGEALNFSEDYVDGFYSDWLDSVLEQAQERIGDVENAAGKLSVKYLVNNAGTNEDGVFVRLTEDNWRNVLQANVIGPVLLTTQVAKRMMKAKDGSIVWVSSIAAKGHYGQANYSASKAAVEAISNTIPAELSGRNIRSNVIAPGFVDTDMTSALSDSDVQAYMKRIPLGRALTTEEVATEIYNVLTGNENGQIIPVDGGVSPNSRGPIQVVQ